MRLLIILLSAALLLACTDKDEPNAFSGQQIVYDLNQGSEFPISGTATFRERISGELELVIALTGTDGDIEHPAHLHYGDISTPDAEVAVLLSPVNGNSGKSVTVFSHLDNETPFSFDDLLAFDGHIKVHQDGGPNKHVILAFGNVGRAAKAGSTTSGRVAVTVCKSK